MITQIHTPKVASVTDGVVSIEMDSGVELRFPVKGNPRLEHGTLEQLNNIDISPFGLHWPDLDEDLSIRGIAEGDYGQRHRGRHVTR